MSYRALVAPEQLTKVRSCTYCFMALHTKLYTIERRNRLSRDPNAAIFERTKTQF